MREVNNSREESVGVTDIPGLTRYWVERHPDKPFLVWEPFAGRGTTWSYADVHVRSLRVAAGLHSRGVRAGDFVIVHLENTPEFVLAWYACAQLGAVAVSTNTGCVSRDLAYFADRTSAVCAITQPRYASMLSEACRDLRFLAITADDAGQPVAHHPEVSGAIEFAALADETTKLPVPKCDPMRNLSVQFTSGTTSRPKAVLWTHANGVWAARACAAHLRLCRDDVTLIYLPLFHTNAQAYSMLATHWSGGTMVLQPRFSASRFWPISVKHRVTWVSTIRFVTQALEAHAVPRHSYRLWGGPKHMHRIVERYGVRSVGWWGMTETLTQGIVCDPENPGPEGTIGRVAPEYEIEIRKKDGSLADPGERGRLFIRGVRGVSLFKEYYGDVQATTDAFDARGWFDTGDVVRADTDGFLYFCDREKDMLKVGGENVSASEIESVIMESGWVKECAVIGRRHAMLDEVPIAFVIPDVRAPSKLAAQLIEHCKSNLAAFKVVHEVHIVTEFPRSTLEKIDKAQLREELEQDT